jgi:hypothetical protein
MKSSQRKSGWWTVALIPVGLAAVMTPAILLAAGGHGDWSGGHGFDAVVHGIESRYGVHATRIPFMGLISGIAGISTHGGVHNLHVAEFENFPGPVDGDELNDLVANRVGEGWMRMIRETSRGGGDQTLIYIRPEGDRIGMLVVERDEHEMNVVQISVNPDKLDDEISHHRHGHDLDASDGDAGHKAEKIENKSEADSE